jgi:hypothetical protein
MLWPDLAHDGGVEGGIGHDEPLGTQSACGLVSAHVKPIGRLPNPFPPHPAATHLPNRLAVPGIEEALGRIGIGTETHAAFVFKGRAQ